VRINSTASSALDAKALPVARSSTNANDAKAAMLVGKKRRDVMAPPHQKLF
jgi:hypothetical protein